MSFPPPPALIHRPIDQRTLHLYTQSFTARHLAEPLPSLDDSASLEQARTIFEHARLPVIGLRAAGRISACLSQDASVGSGRCADRADEHSLKHCLTQDASLHQVIRTLDTHDYCFVTFLGEPAGLIQRRDVQKNPARMWLFGILTYFEIQVHEALRRIYPEDQWLELVTPQRLDKARALHQERQRMGRDCDLIDCLQMGEKALLCARNADWRASVNWTSMRQAKQRIKGLDSLRNHLAHSQDIVTHDWETIANLADRVYEVAQRFCD